MLNSKPLKIDIGNQQYEVVWQDLGSGKRLIVLQGDRTVGFKDFGLLVDEGQGVVEHTIKAILNEQSTILD